MTAGERRWTTMEAGFLEIMDRIAFNLERKAWFSALLVATELTRVLVRRAAEEHGGSR